MSHRPGSIAWRITILWFRVRDLLRPPESILNEVGIGEGDRVLDYGCGPGSFALAAAKRVGPSGKVYAADANAMALAYLQKTAARQGLTNITVIHTDCQTGLESGSVDVALLYDTYHDLRDPTGVLEGLHRVLKPGGLLSFSDHHMGEEEILSGVTAGGRFQLAGKGRRTYTFVGA